jgi:hypothetical protein
MKSSKVEMGASIKIATKVDAFIFDLDGTLLDSETVWVEAYRELLRVWGVRISPTEALKVVYAYRDVYAETIRRFSTLPWSSGELVRTAFRQVLTGREVRIQSSIELWKNWRRLFRFASFQVPAATMLMMAFVWRASLGNCASLWPQKITRPASPTRPGSFWPQESWDGHRHNARCSRMSVPV